MKLLVLGCEDRPENRYARYTGEILRAEGLNWFALENFEGQDSVHLSDYAAVILTRCVLTRDQVERLVDFVKEGGNLVCFRPCIRLGEALGLGPEFSAQKGGYVRLDLSHPACEGLCAEPLQNHGLADHWRLPAGGAFRAAGSIFVGREQALGLPWLILGQCGQGNVAVFTTDLPAQVMAIRQGDPERANTLSGGLDGIYRASELFVGYLDEECALIPQADVLTALLANVIDYLVEHPVPRLWYYPSATQRSMLVMTSDDDWSTVEQFEAMIAALEERDGKCTFYLVPGSHTPPDLVHLWAKRGHRFSCHPDFSAMVSSAEKNHSAYTSFGLDEQVLHFPDIIRTTSDEIRERYGVPIHTVRQHAIRWQGYVDAARVLAAEGIKMETNYYSIQPFAASYMTGSGRPMKFVDENGEIIDVFQQATQVTEDTTIGAHSFAPHWPTDFVLDRMAGIMDASLGGYYTGITVNIHPVSFAGYARELAEGIWDLARERGIPIDSAEDWLDFTRSRYDAELTDISWDQSKLSFSVQLPAKTPQITVMWSSHGRTMESVAVDGIKHDFVVANLWGQEWILLTLEDVSTEARVEVRFV